MVAFDLMIIGYIRELIIDNLNINNRRLKYSSIVEKQKWWTSEYS